MKQLFVLLLAVAAMVSCSKNESVTGPDVPADGVEIKASSMVRTIESKAPFEGAISATQNLTAKVLISTVTGDYSSPIHNGTLTFTQAGTSTGFTPAVYYPSSTADSPVYLVGLYPSTGWGNVQNSNEIEYTFDGSQDVMAAAEVSGTKALAQADTHPAFTFNHLLTKLNLSVKAESAEAAAAWGKVTEITLEQAGEKTPKNQMKVALNTGTATFPYEGTGTFSFYAKDGDAYTDNAFTAQAKELTTDLTEIAYALVAPITADGTKDFKLRVKTQKGSEAEVISMVDIDLTAKEGSTLGDTKGQAFALTLTFKATEITPSATVADWIEGGSAGAEIQ